MTKKQIKYIEDILFDWYVKGIKDGEIKKQDYEKASNFYALELDKMAVKVVRHKKPAAEKYSVTKRKDNEE